MPIEVVPAQLYALSGALAAAAETAARVGAGSAGDVVGGAVGGAVAGLCEATRTAGRCLSGDLDFLAGAVAAAADSWLGLDGSLLPVAGRAVPE